MDLSPHRVPNSGGTGVTSERPRNGRVGRDDALQEHHHPQAGRRRRARLRDRRMQQRLLQAGQRASRLWNKHRLARHQGLPPRERRRGRRRQPCRRVRAQFTPPLPRYLRAEPRRRRGHGLDARREEASLPGKHRARPDPGASPELRLSLLHRWDGAQLEPSTEAEKNVAVLLKSFLERPEKGVLLDMCFKPRRTRMITVAESLGWPCVEGTHVIGYQMEEQWRRWAGAERVRMTDKSISY
jgi:hypothetical protein